EVVQVEEPAVVLGDAGGVARVEPALFGRRVESLGVVAAGELARRELVLVGVLETVPRVANAGRDDRVPLALELEDRVDVRLGPAATPQKGDPEPAVGPRDPGIADRGQRQGGADGGTGPEEVAPIDRRGLRFGHRQGLGGSGWVSGRLLYVGRGRCGKGFRGAKVR